MLIRHMPPPAVVSLPRRFACAAIGGLLVLLAACGGKPDDSAASGTSATEEKILNVYNWADYIEPKVLEDFQKETGIKVRYDVFDSNEVLETKLLTGDSGYDVVVPSAYFLERQIKAGVFRTLDKTQLPHLQNQDPELQAVVAKHDPDNAHSVIYMWGTTGIGYDALKIRAIMPDAPVDSWNLILDPKIVARFKDCGVSVLEDPTDMVATVLLWLGKDPNSESAADLALAEAKLLAIRPYIRTITSSTYTDDLANGVARMGCERLVQVYGSTETAGVGAQTAAGESFRLFPFWERSGDALIREPPHTNTVLRNSMSHGALPNLARPAGDRIDGTRFRAHRASDIPASETREAAADDGRSSCRSRRIARWGKDPGP